MQSIKEKLDLTRLPKHIAIIMDGNGRWAKEHGQPRLFGHREGVRTVHDITEASAELGIEYLTLYAFSTENWNRPPTEVTALMSLLVETVKKELDTLLKNNVRLRAIGNLNGLPDSTRKALLEGVQKTANNTGLTLILALNYSARWEITQAVNTLMEEAKSKQILDPVDPEMFSQYLSTAGIPDPELLIRTSGELRISNFLLWQLAYTELYFTDIFWPEFRRERFYEAILDYQQRERRFGKTSEQLSRV